MATTQKWVLLNIDGVPLDPSDAQKLVDALNEDNGECGPFAQATGRSASVRLGASSDDRQVDEYAMNIRHSIPEAPGALAYHYVTNGVPDIELGWDLFDGVIDGPDPFSVGVDHELKEALRDPGANGWKDGVNSNGKASADEACDKVQNTFRKASNGVTLSNFLLESAFIPGAAAPYDALGVMTSQDDLSNGYDIEADVENVTQVHSDADTDGSRALIAIEKHATKRKVTMRNATNLTPKQLKRKTHPWSRAHRRGFRHFHESASEGGEV